MDMISGVITQSPAGEIRGCSQAVRSGGKTSNFRSNTSNLGYNMTLNLYFYDGKPLITKIPETEPSHNKLLLFILLHQKKRNKKLKRSILSFDVAVSDIFSN